MKTDRLYLNDSQYHDLLYDSLHTINIPDFKPCAWEDNTPGDHDSGINCGLCTAKKGRSEYSELDWVGNHKCPFDTRKTYDPNMGWNWGCWYRCIVVNWKNPLPTFYKKIIKNQIFSAIEETRNDNQLLYKLRLLSQMQIQEFETALNNPAV